MDTTTDQTGQPFTWRAHPAREHAGRAVVAVLIIAAAAACVGLAGGTASWLPLAGASALLLLVTLNRFFLPSVYTIDPEGITARYPFRTVRKRWADLRRFVHDRHGGYLSTRARSSRLDAYRGVHILFGAQRDAVIQRIRRCLREVGTS